MRKIYLIIINKKLAIADKVDFRAQISRDNKGEFFKMIKGSIKRI